MTNYLTAAVVACLGLAACQDQGGGDAKSADPYAGLDAEIQAWHGEIKTADPACRDKPQAQQCRAFEVACKGARELSEHDAAEGVTAKVAVALDWEAWDSVREEFRRAGATAEFRKAAGAWSRHPTGPVNQTTCAAT